MLIKTLEAQLMDANDSHVANSKAISQVETDLATKTTAFALAQREHEALKTNLEGHAFKLEQQLKVMAWPHY